MPHPHSLKPATWHYAINDLDDFSTGIMRILQVHNFYRLPGGEDAVFHNEASLLERHGHDVFRFTRSNESIDESTLTGKAGLAFNTIWSTDTYREITSIIRKKRPNIAHFHNIHPLISPSGYAACRDCSVPVVQTLHNYRLVCPGALLQRNGSPCEKCIGKPPLPAIMYSCYKNSLTATLALSASIVWNRAINTYRSSINRYIALTNFSASKFIAGGIEPSKIIVKPNFLPDPPETGAGSGDYFLYVGRLSPEKGVMTLLRAWEHLQGRALKIVGDGPLEAQLLSYAEDHRLAIDFLGKQPRERVLELMREATALIIPSEWYEGFPMVVLESYACGTPVISSRIGSLQEVILENTTGFLFEPGNPLELASLVKAATQRSSNLSGMRKQARNHFDENYAAENNYRMLTGIYEQVMIESREAID